MQPSTRISFVLAFWIGTGVACGNGGPSGTQLLEQKAAAEAQKKAQEEAERAQAMERRKAEREAAEKAAEEAKTAREAALARITVLPDKLPRDYVKACEDVAKAEDAFMQRHLKGPELEAWNAKKENAFSMTVVQCGQVESEKVAACQKNALDQAGPEFVEYRSEIFRVCTAKFGPKASPSGAVVPPKLPGR